MRVFVRLPSGELVEVEASLDECVAVIVGRPLALWRIRKAPQRQCQDLSDGGTDLDPVDTVRSDKCADSSTLNADLSVALPLAGCTVRYGGVLLPPERTLRECGAQAGCVLEASLGRDYGLKGGMQGSFAMQIAYKRDKESKRRLAENSPFVSCISQLHHTEKLRRLKEDEELVDPALRYKRVPPDPNPPADPDDFWLNVEHKYLRFAWNLHAKVTSTPYFEAFIMLNIFAVGITTGLSLNGNADPDTSPRVAYAVDWVTQITFVVFILEAILKIVAYGPVPWHYFTSPNGEGYFNGFDFLLVMLSVALINQDSAGAIKTLRLARLVRLLAIVKNVPELKVIVEGLIAGLKSVGYIVLLLLLVIYLFAVLGTMMFGRNDPANFGTVSIAMMTLFCMSTLTWSEVAYVEYHGCNVFEGGGYADVPYKEDPKDRASVSTLTGSLYAWECDDPSAQPMFALLYFTAFTILTAMVILSLFIGVIAMGMFDSYENMKRIKEEREYEEGLADRQKQMFAPGSVLAVAVDLAMAHEPRKRSAAKEDIAWREAVRQMAVAASKVEEHRYFRATITGGILVAGIVIGLSTDSIGDPAFLFALDFVCLLLFSLEAIVKIAAFGTKPRRYFNDSWNRFDFIIVLNGWLEVIGQNIKGLTVLRLLRLLRVFRLVKALPRLRSIVESLIQGFTSVVWIIILMIIFNYIMGCLGMLLFAELDPFYYKSVLQSLFTTYQIETLDGWDVVYKKNMYGCGVFPDAAPALLDDAGAYECVEGTTGLGWIAAVYFVLVVVFGGLILPTMLIGIVAISFEESYRRSEADRQNSIESEKLQAQVVSDMPKFFTPVRLELFKHVFSEMDVNDGGTLDLNEVTPLLQYLCYRHLRVQLTADEVEALVLFFDDDDSSDLCFGELLMILRYLIKARNQGKLRAIMTKDAQVERRSTKRIEINGEVHEFDAGSDYFKSQPNSRGGSFDTGSDAIDPIANAPRIRTPLQRQPSRMSSRDEFGTKAISDEFLAWQREHMEVAVGIGDGSSEPNSPVPNDGSSGMPNSSVIESSTRLAGGDADHISEASGSGNDVVKFSFGATGSSHPKVTNTVDRTPNDGGISESKSADETVDNSGAKNGSSSLSSNGVAKSSGNSSSSSSANSPSNVNAPAQQPTLFTRTRSNSRSPKLGSRSSSSSSMDEPPLLAIDLNSDGTETEKPNTSDEPVTAASVAALEEEVAKLRAQLRQVVGPSLHERSHAIAAAALPYADSAELAAVVDSKLSGPFRQTYSRSPKSAGFLPKLDSTHQQKKHAFMSEDSVSVL